MRKGVAILLTLPDTRVVFQRRDAAAPSSPGRLAPWGGAVEAEDTSLLSAAMREMGEENDVDRDHVAWKWLGSFLVPAPAERPHDELLLAVFHGIIPPHVFGVHEGVGAEAVDPAELVQHPRELSDVGRLVLPHYIENVHRPAA